MNGMINVQDTGALAEDSRVVLKECEGIRSCIDSLRTEKERLSFWKSAQKDDAFASLDMMSNQLQKLVEMAESYGNVGIQSAVATEAAEDVVKDLNSKLNNYLG